jgi:hypothetical protein
MEVHMTKKTNAKSAAKAPISKAAKKAPGNAKALQDKAADNVKKINSRKGRIEAIKTATMANNGHGPLLVVTTRDRSIVVARQDAQTNALVKVGQPVAPLEDYLKTQPKPQAKLARGVEGKMTENSRKAVQDQKTPASQPAKAAAPAKSAKNKQPSRGADRDYTKGKTAIAAKPDSWRHHMLTVITKHGNTAKAKAAHEKSGKFAGNKLDFNWAAAQGYINWAK